MTVEEEVSRLIRQASQTSQILDRLNCPQELRTVVLLALLLRDSSPTGIASDIDGLKVKLRIDDFFDRFTADNKGEYLLAAAYYLHAVEGREDFTAVDVQSVLRQARIGDLAANTTDMLSKLTLRKKWFIETGVDGKQKLWALSRDGERFAQKRMEDKRDD